jgi:FMN phosphatase YigB (HAD superfamily)
MTCCILIIAFPRPVSLSVKINFVAIDFDQTIIDIHTGGKWNGTAAELTTHVRPQFAHFLRAAAEASLHIAVVTFSPQVGYVSEVLRMHFPAFADRVVIRGRDGSWSYEGGGSRKGKQAFIASAVEELETKYTTDISKSTAVLIDDDHYNVSYAIRDGMRAIWLEPTKPETFFQKVLEMV